MLKRLILVLIICGATLVAAQTRPSGTTMVASDNFTRANSSTTLGANWTTDAYSVWGINSDQSYMVSCTSSSGYCFVVYTGSTLGASPYASVTWAGTIIQTMVLALKPTTSSDTGYILKCTAGSGGFCTTERIYRCSSLYNFTCTQIATVSNTYTVSSTTFSLYDNAGTVSAYANGTQIMSISDATYTPTVGAMVNLYTDPGTTYPIASYFEVGNKTVASTVGANSSGMF